MLESVAQDIASIASNVTGYYIVITDEKGIIIGTSDAEEPRMGTLHEGSLDVSEEELAERRKEWTPPETKAASGFANLYQRLCRPADQGGAMQPWDLDAKYQSAKPPKV